jgi:peptide deformylase
MAYRKIVVEGDETLRKTARPVEKIDARLLSLLDDMAETMYAADGIGLAAPQVGVLKRVFVVDLHDGSGLLEFINPVISNRQGSQTGEEGCLSCPGASGAVERPATLDIEATDRNGNVFTIHADGLMAVCVSHENDHLDGVLFIDKIEGELTRS